MRMKRSVAPDAVQPQTWYALGAAEAVYRQHGHVLTVTSLRDSHETRPASLHNTGMAADTRTRSIPAGTLAAIVRDLKLVLDPQGYDIVLESNHIHIEFDPKADQVWLSVTD